MNHQASQLLLMEDVGYGIVVQKNSKGICKSTMEPVMEAALPPLRKVLMLPLLMKQALPSPLNQPILLTSSVINLLHMIYRSLLLQLMALRTGHPQEQLPFTLLSSIMIQLVLLALLTWLEHLMVVSLFRPP